MVWSVENWMVLVSEVLMLKQRKVPRVLRQQHLNDLENNLTLL